MPSMIKKSAAPKLHASIVTLAKRILKTAKVMDIAISEAKIIAKM